MQFKIEADGTFEAENIDDALTKIGTYFIRLRGDDDDPVLLDTGQISIQPVSDYAKKSKISQTDGV